MMITGALVGALLGAVIGWFLVPALVAYLVSTGAIAATGGLAGWHSDLWELLSELV